MSDIPDEWVEKAARIIFRRTSGDVPDWHEITEHDRNAWRDDARAVLEAVWDDIHQRGVEEGLDSTWKLREYLQRVRADERRRVAEEYEAKLERVRAVYESMARTGYPDALVRKGQVLDELRAALEGESDA